MISNYIVICKNMDHPISNSNYTNICTSINSHTHTHAHTHASDKYTHYTVAQYTNRYTRV